MSPAVKITEVADWMLLKESVPAPRVYLFHLMLHSYDYNIHVEILLTLSLCLFSLLSSEQCSQFERFHLQHVEMVNKTNIIRQ